MIWTFELEMLYVVTIFVWKGESRAENYDKR